MSVEVEFDLSGLEAALSERVEAAQKVLVQTVAEDSGRYVPVRTGELKGNVDIGEDSVTWTQDYARYVYNMDHVVSEGNPDGAPQWFEVAKANHLGEWVEKVRLTAEGGA